MVLSPAAMRLRSALVLASMLLAVGCDEKPLQDGKKPPAGLTRQQAAAVLARVGAKTITVGDFAAALERLDDIDRLRYQTPERRKELLQKMIDLELLAEEAKSRGLDKEPSVQLATRQILREAMLAKARAGARAPADVLPAEIAAYYEAHKKEFEEPQRRRIAAIVLADAAQADDVVAKAQKLDSPQKWGDLYFEKSLDAPKVREAHAPADLAGDLGLVGNGEDARAKNAGVPDEVAQAAFTLEKVGDVYAKAVRAGDRFYVVRLTGMSKGHVRTLAEAERGIRAAILQENAREREASLEADMRKRFPVRVDDAALVSVVLPRVEPDENADAVTPSPSVSAAGAARP